MTVIALRHLGPAERKSFARHLAGGDFPGKGAWDDGTVVLDRVLDGLGDEAGRALIEGALAKASRMVVVTLGGEAAARWTPEVLGPAFVYLLGEAIDADSPAVALAFLDGPGRPRLFAPRFSVMVPVYNHRDLIGACLDSIAAQSWPLWEAVVVDDGSTDGVATLLTERAAADPRLRWSSQANGGTGAALNACLAMAREEWIAWLSSDDLFAPDKLAAHAALLRRDGLAPAFHHTAVIRRNDAGEEQVVAPLGPLMTGSAGLRRLAMTSVNLIQGISIVVHRDLFAQTAGFDPRNRFTQDYAMWVRLMERTDPVYLPLVTAVTRVGAAQTTARHYQRTRAEAIAAILGALRDFSAGAPDDREARLEAVAALVMLASSPHGFLARYGLQGWYVARAMGLAAEAKVLGATFADVSARLGPWSVGHIHDPQAMGHLAMIESVFREDKAAAPIDPFRILTRMLISPTIPADLAEAITGFLRGDLPQP
ncbi:glycosyltransferase family 2 protein [Rhodospirillum rubrum]|uniref:Glycosyl transferase, family 2 n=1 Tax=Rhodospirillum rubrum (strain ATCC 11170 / ATH 1.1.1 / DSM 467 / LMG 4362 / NCIMB 8255 / S1) TaxID=269796 RepID=Q2RQR1_RHORT|nr:glycosyltransferase [Rhodospirillum rubrum]ABC23534.1 Glycosyl transferase, family 2 [Rhodospirillum rubrum ATCC 11170]AEO49273.1 glycosyl transferase family protein [Rhodospirillum rubrum F11]MBK5955208.1 glycosyl transferase [Rhodospirillum rubrum]QXG79501.1 glycosyltransferase [Rhodospirillum rubrum]HAQ01084.1 glycosyl transferase [Rhodospirillum rubrum]